MVDFTPEQFARLDPCYWACFHRIRLANGNAFSLEDHWYQEEPMRSKAARMCYMKATGGGFSEIEILKTIHGMIMGRYPQGAGYYFPTETDMQDFSKSRFNPLIRDNREVIGKFVKTGRKATDAAGLKIINGHNLYLRGARLNPSDEGTGARRSTKVTSIQIDRAVLDEVDQMELLVAAKIRGRMAHAAVDGVKGASEEVYLANPTDEDTGIDLFWQKSDQRQWFRKCDCLTISSPGFTTKGAFTCAELEFINNPEKCIGFENGRGFVKCKNCGKPVGIPGEWVAQKPDVKDLDGYQWGHLTSVYHDPGRILRDFRDPPEGNLGDVYRLDLGLPYSSKEDKLRKSDVLACCGNDTILEHHKGPCAMGVDVGKVKHVIIGARTGNDRYEIFKPAIIPESLNSWGDIHDLARRFNVKSAVIDIRPYEDEVRQFQRAEKYRIFLCEYTESPLQEGDFNSNTGIVKAYRTGMFDRSHRIITNEQIRLPRQSAAIDEFAQQCCNCVKSKVEDKQRSRIIYRYRPTGSGQEHYRNALNYFLLAAEQSRVVTVIGNSNRPKTVISEYART